MKKLIVLMIILIMISVTSSEAKPRPGSFSIGMFYSSLSPYGEWIEIDAGLIVWRPNSVHAYWRPYSIGRWTWTKYGWYWDSFEPFGWATYHYGRWYYDDYYGWIWIPDNIWGPAWVEWRYDDVYIGWAPLPPYAQFRIGFGIYFSINWNSPYSYWNFVTYKHFHSHRLHYYLIDPSRNYRIFSKTKYRNNYYSDRDRIINGGIDREYIERRSGYRIAERNIEEVSDFQKYNRSRKSIVERVYAYRPSDREIENTRDNRNIEVKRADRRSSLDVEKIAITERNSTEREVINERNNDRLVERNDPSKENYNFNRRDVFRNDAERKTNSESRTIAPRNDEPKIERRNPEERKNNNPEIFQRREEVKREPLVQPRREINRESESRNYRNENPSRSVERSTERSRESSERKSVERESSRRR